ncbi:ribbon-helix-helix protein, CopG family, partial [Acinetobacter baumannii]
PKKAPTRRLTLRLDESTYAALEALAEEHQRPISEVAREALKLLAEEYQQRRTKASAKPGETPPQRPPEAPSENSLLTFPEK